MLTMTKLFSKKTAKYIFGVTKFHQQLSIVLAVIFILGFFCYGCTIGGQAQNNAGSLERVLSCGSLGFVREIKLDFDTLHVQGLEVVGKYGYVTSVDNKSGDKKGWLFKIKVSDGTLVQKRELTDGERIHPGGLQYDGRYLWIAVAEYRPNSSTTIMAVNPKTLRPVKSFSVNDHIGALACDGQDRLFGVNWDSEQFYLWSRDGDEIEVLVSSTSMLRYQDVKFLDGILLCCGYRGSVSAIDLIDTTDWELKKRIVLPQRPKLSREGMAYRDGKFYFLPEDSPNSRIFIFEVQN